MQAGEPLTIELSATAVCWPGGRIAARLLPRLLAALLQAHAEGGARAGRPCDRTELRARLHLPELHRTQLWRAWGRLVDTPLAGLVQAQALSSGPYWLDPEHLARLAWRVDPALALPTPPTIPASLPLLPMAYVESLARADHLLDRGALYPARACLAEAAASLPAGDTGAALAVLEREARIARRLGDWAGLQRSLRGLRARLADAGLDAPTRHAFAQRAELLDAWHSLASMGHADAALQRLAALDQRLWATDPGLQADALNLRGLARRDVALEHADAALARAALDDLAAALRAAALAGLSDALQVVSANLANTLHRLAEGGLAPADGPSALEALRWLLLSEAVCARRALAPHSLLGAIFLLNMADRHALRFAQVVQLAAEAGLSLEGAGFADWAAARWAQLRPLLAQVPAEQRCAFVLLWSRHAEREGDLYTALELLGQARHHARKLRAGARRTRYEAEIAATQARLSPP